MVKVRIILCGLFILALICQLDACKKANWLGDLIYSESGPVLTPGQKLRQYLNNGGPIPENQTEFESLINGGLLDEKSDTDYTKSMLQKALKNVVYIRKFNDIKSERKNSWLLLYLIKKHDGMATDYVTVSGSENEDFWWMPSQEATQKYGAKTIDYLYDRNR